MSTRGYMGIVANRKGHFAYNHSDSYPSWLGVRVLEVARKAAAKPDAYRELARELRHVDEGADFTDEDFAKYGEHHQQVSTGKDWYSLLRSLQGDLDGYLVAGVMPAEDDPSGFDHEWGYTIDLDDRTFEVRHWRRGVLATYPLDALPTDEDLCALEG